LTTYIIDASVAVRWVVDLPHQQEARSLLTFRNRLLAPDFLHAEVGNALTKLIRGKAVSHADGMEAYEDFFRAPVHVLPARPLAHQAMKLALKSGQSLYDCLYLSLAISETGLFATADGRFWKAMKATPHAKHIHFIGIDI